MKQVSANEAKQSLGKVIDTVQREPVVIQRYNRDAAVMLSMQDYEKLTALNIEEFDRFCDRVGERAKKRGLTTSKLKRILNAD
ncbi:MAG: type II toxin-antitoxin system prevent-host-death family antitoxin [Opitutae bacterium]|nr:type II toxin-antitoxin system prevent-host-death family antitoxin [Opitutae bacterium]